MSPVLRPLDTERVIPKLIGVLDIAGFDTGLLPQYLLTGVCGVLAEAPVPLERLYLFDEGGLNPRGSLTARPGYLLADVRGNSSSIASALVGEPGLQTYYVHEPLKRPDEVSTNDGPFLVVEGQLFYARDAVCLGVEDTASFVARNTLSWHFLMFCVAGPIRGYERLGDLLVDSAQLVCGVYDGESYLIWRRRHC